MLFQQVANARPVLETTKNDFNEGNGKAQELLVFVSRKCERECTRLSFSNQGKKDPSTVSLFCIGHKCFIFETQTPRTLFYILGIVPHTFSQSIGRKVRSLGGELRCNPK